MIKVCKGKAFRLVLCFFLFCEVLTGCGRRDDRPAELVVPRGYVPVIDIELSDRLISFGPFVGYYFSPETPDALTRLRFICFNERSFYTRDLPENIKLFEGEAVLTHLEDLDMGLPASDRINPIFFSEAPAQWLESRPEPRDEFVHFHSGYDSQGPVLTGYWLRHNGMATFTYDMGGRLKPDSPLYHEVRPGPDKSFARILEFDRGPGISEQ